MPLQGDVIDAQNRALQASDKISKTVEDSVKSDFKKSYSEAAASQNTASTGSVISPEALKSVAKQVIVEKELSKNIMIFGLPENENEDIQKCVGKIFEEIGEKPKLNAVRIGKHVQSKVRPVKVTLSSSSAAQNILSRSRMLRQSDSYKTVFLSPDRTVEERIKHRELVLQLKEKTVSEPNRRHYIKEGAIVSVNVTGR